MKQENMDNTIAKIFLAGFLLDVILLVYWFGPDLSDNQYLVQRLSPESNLRGNEEKYFYRDGSTVICYSLETGEETKYEIPLPEYKKITDGEFVEDQMYYILTNHTVRRFDFSTKTDEEIFSEEDICSMCGIAELSDEVNVAIARTKKNWILTVSGCDEEEQYYICPIDGDLKTDCVEVNTLYSKDDRTGAEQVVLCRGMRIRRCYDVEKKAYRIIELGEKDGRPEIFSSALKETTALRINGKLVSISFQKGEKFYWREGDLEEREIGCLDASEFGDSVISSTKLTTENGEVIGLLHVVKNFRCDGLNPPQNELEYDALFRLNPETGENSILYQTRSKRIRIIGYQEGVVYLLNTYGNQRAIYAMTVKSGKARRILGLPKDANYIFDWQGDYLIVICKDSIVGSYKVK